MIALATALPLEDKVPLSGSNYPLARDSSKTRLPLREVQRLGQDVRQLLEGSDADQLYMAILDHLMSEVLPDANVLRALSATNDVVSDFAIQCTRCCPRTPESGMVGRSLCSGGYEAVLVLWMHKRVQALIL